MSVILNNLEPSLVFSYFEEISQIPRGSGNEKAISDYLVKFAKEKNLKVIQDNVNNVIIKKPGTPGYENAPTVILQGHMDMVCEKNKDTIHDFEKDPLNLRIIDDMIYATDTTLGADNGIAIALSLALLASKDIPHPALEVLITVEEETGLSGAAAVNEKHLDGKYLINMDSEEEGRLLVSCAGGARTIQSIPIVWEMTKPNLVSYAISITGLKGGHSGMEIDKGRGNSNKLIGRVLNALDSQFEYYIKEINGGSKMNAIPREADAVILLRPQDVVTLEDNILIWKKIISNELRAVEEDFQLNIEKIDYNYAEVFSKETKDKVIASLILIPNGIQTMSMEIPGLVESSTNLGVVTTTNSTVNLESAVRSSVKSLKAQIISIGKKVAQITETEFSVSSDYPQWEYNPVSELRKIFIKVYETNYGKTPDVYAIHAGVECGLFKEKLPDLDMISFGANMYDVHTPNEHVSISSIQRTWDYLLAVLKEIK
jgi:dipeptidase D